MEIEERFYINKAGTAPPTGLNGRALLSIPMRHGICFKYWSISTMNCPFRRNVLSIVSNCSFWVINGDFVNWLGYTWKRIDQMNFICKMLFISGRKFVADYMLYLWNMFHFIEGSMGIVFVSNSHILVYFGITVCMTMFMVFMFQLQGNYSATIGTIKAYWSRWITQYRYRCNSLVSYLSPRYPSQFIGDILCKFVKWGFPRMESVMESYRCSLEICITNLKDFFSLINPRISR